jgi:hypothetical protein
VLSILFEEENVYMYFSNKREVVNMSKDGGVRSLVTTTMLIFAIFIESFRIRLLNAMTEWLKTGLREGCINYSAAFISGYSFMNA